ncbi:MAG: DUF1761 domain-containing protein [Candidatus Eremiobacteraeota bacterium]|nr:DUF1761 domain-containing protein [Candidatus Eremiobacteraeota bacterium]
MTARRPNYLGIIAGTIVLFAWGAVWYIVLGNAWAAAAGVNPNAPPAYGFWPYVVSLGAGLLVSYCFDNMLWHYETGSAAKGAQIGFLIGVCIFAAMIVEMYAFQGRPVTLMLIDGGYGIIGFTITGAVVGALRAWAGRRVTAPG